MHRFEEHIEVGRDPEVAFDLLADYTRDTAWRTEVTEMTASPPGPAAVGTRTLEVARVLGGTFVTPGRVTGVVPGRSFTWEARSDGLEARGGRTVTALGPQRCRVTLSYELSLLGRQRVLEPVLAAVFRRRVRANLRELRTLLAHAERPAADATMAEGSRR